MIILLVSFLVLSSRGKDITVPDVTNPPALEEINQPLENLKEDEKQESRNEINKRNLSPIPDKKEEIYQVVLYFADNDLTNTYRIRKEVKARRENQLPKAALEEWIRGPEHEELKGIIPADVIIEYVEDINGIAHVSFSRDIRNSNLGSSGELIFAEQLAMIMQQFGFSKTQILIEGRVSESLFGSLYIGDPIAANDPESYLWVNEKKTDLFVVQNVAFRIYEPSPHAQVKNRIVVRGLARVFEGTIQYEFEDGHFILDKGFTTATEGAPGWGEFEIIIEIDEVTNYSGRVILYEESAKDGSRLHELQIPVSIRN